MDYKKVDKIVKPDDWPANDIELQLETISKQVDRFISNPSYICREELVSLVSFYDLNQKSTLGLFRTTDYEIATINTLFVQSHVLQFNSLKSYLYELIGIKTQMQKMASYLPVGATPRFIPGLERLMPALKLYSMAYFKFNSEKTKSFSEQLIGIIEEAIAESKENDTEEVFSNFANELTHAYISLINDISYFRCVKVTQIWAFSREEIVSLFQEAARLVKLTNDNPKESPLKGVLMTSISNYILKSRHNYNQDYICKYVSKTVAAQSVENHEIWMADISHLNDSREQHVIPELFQEHGWINYSWAHDIDFTPSRTYYVSSFCKSIGNTDMARDYGDCLYGYKDDRIADLIAPIHYWKPSKHKEYPAFTQVVVFDVLYSREEAKCELQLLFQIIDLFDMTQDDKKAFLEEILQYWILSVKDPKWQHERERRYVLFLYDTYTYKETDRTDPRFLKIKTSLFVAPDFVLGDNPVKYRIKPVIDAKRKGISLKPYLYCPNCLSRDYDAAAMLSEITPCPICGAIPSYEIIE